MDQAIAIVDDGRFDKHEHRGGGHPERPERLAAARSGLFGVVPEGRRVSIAARSATLGELTTVHQPQYVTALESALSGGGWGHLDPDTYYCPDSYEATWLAAGGAIDMARNLVTGAQRLGVALLRPPGHHAEPGTSMGFCLINNMAVAAQAARGAGAKRVAIVDWDVHHGNGTQHAFYSDPNVLFISLHQFPFYPGTGAPQEVGAGPGEGYTANVAIPGGCGPATYGMAFRRIVEPLLTSFAPDVVLVSAGFDAHSHDPLASMELDAATYQAMTTSLLGPAGNRSMGVLLEGGYDLTALESSVAGVARALTGAGLELPDGAAKPEGVAAVESTLRALRPYWPVLAEG